MTSSRRWLRAAGGPILLLLASAAGAQSYGDPLPGLTPGQGARFLAGQEAFLEVETPATGLGPVFNGVSCASCHRSPAVGGGSGIVETRFGRVTQGKFDPLPQFGGSLIQSEGIGPAGSCNFAGETVPPQATIVAGRLTSPLFGLGLVAAVPGEVFLALAASQRISSPQTAGRPSIVANVVNGRPAVGKFGWKAQVHSLYEFSGDAYLNEMGITNPLFREENCPQGNCSALVCDPARDPEDNGEDLENFTYFITFLGAPPRGRVSRRVGTGEAIFVGIGCASCHYPTLQTGPQPFPALDHVILHPYSDFLLHDMGSLGDGIEQGGANGREMRTAPLWGLRVRRRFLHDGRALTLDDAILAHDGQGQAARESFATLSSREKRYLRAFLKSL